MTENLLNLKIHKLADQKSYDDLEQKDTSALY